MPDHPTQIFLHNPQALRIEFVVDSGELILWWSPKAGESFEDRDRNFSNRDDHLNVFERIALPGLGLDRFSGCDYDPYHCVLRFGSQRVHIATMTDAAVALVWCERPQVVEFRTGRYDQPLSQADDLLAVRHPEPAYTFEFAAALAEGAGAFTHQHLRADTASTYARADLAAGQLLTVGASLEGGQAQQVARDAARLSPVEHLARIDQALEPHVRAGRWDCSHRPDLARLRDLTVRGLHSTIDDSGTLRASIKAIYYLIWVRDSAFCFGYQEAAGWPHRLSEWCRLLLANPVTVDEPAVPPGRMFAQLVNKRFGKLEEDGIYYAVWSLFTRCTQSPAEPIAPDELALLREAMAYIEGYIFDDQRGLFGEYFADETPMKGARDARGDFAIGKPAGPGHGPTVDGESAMRSYDIYINLLMHAAWTMLAALTDDEQAADAYADKADRLWERLAPFFEDLGNALPPYGEFLLESGRRAVTGPFGPAKSVYVWALSLPTFAPVPGIDGIRVCLLESLLADPAGHWINGICSTIASVDPWVCPEARLIDAIEQIADQSWLPGAYLPMGGAIMEKFDAPQGNLYHDIRPQAFAQSSWLAACASLGVRRLPYGLAVRPTRFFSTLTDYHWQGRRVSFGFGDVQGLPRVRINGQAVVHTLQLPESLLTGPANEVLIESGGAQPCLLRSTARLEAVEADGGMVRYRIAAYGLTELVFAEQPRGLTVRNAQGEPIEANQSRADGLFFVRFRARGLAEVACER